MSGEVVSLLETLARACRVLEMEGHGDMTLGHLSARDPAGRGFWMKRNAIGLGEVCGPQDFVLVDFDTGEVLEGAGGRHSEWPIHAEIFRRRPDVNAVAHTHPSAVCALSALKTDLLPLGVDANYFSHPIPRFDDTAVLIKSPDLGRAMAESLGDHYAVILANHGATFCGNSIEVMTLYGIWLESAARMHLSLAPLLSEARIPAPDQLAERQAQILSAVHIQHSWAFLIRKLESRFAPGKPFYVD
jgi:ribulose-5-phosphate 4-epimerase/fuculose-1-phosphate aldolase